MPRDEPAASRPEARAERPIPILRRSTVLWRHLDGPGMQIARITDIPDGHTLDGRVLTVFDGAPAEVHFAIMCAADWTTRFAAVTVLQGESSRSIQLRRDEDGRWWRMNGKPGQGDPGYTELPELEGVSDVDFGISPATNTLPIRRLRLEVGEARDSGAAWVGFPSLDVELLPQRYAREASNVYRYESNGASFTAQLDVDDDGIVVRYDDLWDRIAAGTFGA